MLDGKTLAQRMREFTAKLNATKGFHEYCDMRMTEISPLCNTPGCHAGWAAIVLGDKPLDTIAKLELNFNRISSDPAISNDNS